MSSFPEKKVELNLLIWVLVRNELLGGFYKDESFSRRRNSKRKKEKLSKKVEMTTEARWIL